MPTIQIVTTPEEQQKIYDVIKRNQHQVIAVSRIAELAHMNQNRVRYIVTDLEEAGRIKRIPAKAFNEHYIRYSYEVLNGQTNS